MSTQAFIIAAKRTPIGSFQGQFADVPAPILGKTAIQAALQESQLGVDQIEECILGQVLTAGSGQAPARQAALGAGLSPSVPCMSINKVCGSGLKAVMLATDSIRLGRAHAVVAGGQENMTLSPHLMMNARAGYRMGHVQTLDSMLTDGLWDPYHNFHMGNAAELCAREYKFTREEQDRFAIGSYEKAQRAMTDGSFAAEIVGVSVKTKSGPQILDKDEEPSRTKFDKIPQLRPAFEKDGTITAANASKINDGAAALVLVSEEKLKSIGAKPLARVVAQAHFAQEPKWFTTAPVEAMKRALKLANLSASEIDLWEINEAFANVTMAAERELKITRERVNVNGGAVALGHPIGASGARILTTLVHALQKHKKRYGVASLCIGGGEAVAVVIERP